MNQKIKKQKVTGMTPSVVLDLMKTYGDVFQLELYSFFEFMKNVPKDGNETFMIKRVGDNVLIGLNEEEKIKE